jgi:hypothetical protein
MFHVKHSPVLLLSCYLQSTTWVKARSRDPRERGMAFQKSFCIILRVATTATPAPLWREQRSQDEAFARSVGTGITPMEKRT